LVKAVVEAHGGTVEVTGAPGQGIAHRIRSLAIPGEFGQSAYLAEELYAKYGLTGPRMAEAALDLLKDH
ncbi:MAG: hypothetical protein ACKPGI_06960, partial [Verrucomicrobiota bacterium]